MKKEVKSKLKLFVEVAKFKSAIKNEGDVEKLQEDMDRLYFWQEDNNMKFNGAKFQLLRYGTDEDLKENTLYFTANMEEIIQQYSSLRDLGFIMTDNGRFEEHIDKVTRTVRQKVGWVLRTLYTRRSDIMKQLWKTLIQCHIDYCSQLYMPSLAHGMQSIEKLFYDYSSKIPEVREESYWKRLQSLNMYSQERRMKRYRIIYIWKTLEDFVPNCGVSQAPLNTRLGRKCLIPSLKPNGRRAVQTLREQSFQVNGARLFNCLPKKLRDIRFYQDDFKSELDNYLSTVPDQPCVGSLVPEAVCRVTSRQSNSLTAWIQET